MSACWFVRGCGVLGLSVALAAGVQAQDAATQDAATQEPASKPVAEKPVAEGAGAEGAGVTPVKAAAKKTDKPNEKKADKSDKKIEEKAEAKAEKPAATQEDVTITTVDKLPGPLKTLHVCAMPKATVELDSEAYAKATVFVISCTAARGALTPNAVYVARDAKGTGARQITFEALAPDGAPSKLEMLYSVTPAREAFTMEGDQQPHAHVKEDTPWFVGAWTPDDRPGVCAVSATWKLQGDKAELHLWEEAKECPKGELPKYEAKIDKKPPALVGGR